MTKLGILEAGAILPGFAEGRGQMGDWFVRFLSLADDSLTFVQYESYKGNLPRMQEIRTSGFDERGGEMG